MKSKLLCRDDFSSDQIDILFAPSSRATYPQLEQRIKEVWRRQLASAAMKGDKLWGSEAYRLNSFLSQDSRLKLEIATVPYSVHSALKELHSEPHISEDHADRLLVADALVRTSDNLYVLAHVDKVSEQATVLLGGSCSKNRLPELSPHDLFDFATDRLVTVLGIPKKSFETPVLKGVIFNEVGSVHLILRVPPYVPAKIYCKILPQIMESLN